MRIWMHGMVMVIPSRKQRRRNARKCRAATMAWLTCHYYVVLVVAVVPLFVQQCPVVVGGRPLFPPAPDHHIPPARWSNSSSSSSPLRRTATTKRTFTALDRVFVRHHGSLVVKLMGGAQMPTIRGHDETEGDGTTVLLPEHPATTFTSTDNDNNNNNNNNSKPTTTTDSSANIITTAPWTSRLSLVPLVVALLRRGLSLFALLLTAVFWHSTSTQDGEQQQLLLSWRSVYAWALLGSSLGFYHFLYFISLGYALGIFLPVAACLVKYYCYSQHQHQHHRTRIPTAADAVLHAPATTLLHTGWVLLWAIRLGLYLAWREYRGWPALHRKIVQVDSTIPWGHKVLCWLVYSFLYVCLLSPCWFRWQQFYSDAAAVSSFILPDDEPNTITIRSSARTLDDVASTAGLILQGLGLILETVADWQKSHWKQQQRTPSHAKQRGSSSSNISSAEYSWCPVGGVWRYSTHPNYAGEWLFWCGTFLAALPAVIRGNNHSHHYTPEGLRRVQVVVVILQKLAFMLMGFAFLSTILAGAAQKLDDKHWIKYGHDPNYVQFRQRTGMFGPKWWWWRHRPSSQDTPAATTTSTTNAVEESWLETTNTTLKSEGATAAAV